MTSGITGILSAFAADADIDPPASAHEMMRLSLMDWCAVAMAGRSEPVGESLRALALDEGGAAQAHAVGLPVAVPARMAALVNGTVSHALDYDDTHFAHIGHPSVAVFPAALAVAERIGADRARFEEAALIGLEASIRVGLWLGREHYQVGFHQTATAGTFGAALAAARLLGFDAERAARTLGLAATRASGLKAQFGTMGKPFNAGLAAANGVEAALLVERDFRPRAEALEGANGFSKTHHGAADLSALESLGRDWLFETVSHKFHACCHGLHATLEALAAQGPLSPETVTAVSIETHPRWMTVCNIAAPETGLEAKFSYAQVVALALAGHDTARLETFSTELATDPALAELRARVTVTATDTLGETEARVTTLRADGSAQTSAHDLTAPMALDTRRDRLAAKAQALLGGERAAQLAAMAEGDAAPDQIGALLAG